MDKESINIGIDTEAPATEKEFVASGFSRRGFVQRSGKALYLVPTLTLLGSATVSAQGTCVGILCPSAPLDAPAAPAPTE